VGSNDASCVFFCEQSCDEVAENQVAVLEATKITVTSSRSLSETDEASACV
jgi:hypothetical protein